jgi:type IV pilus assembly protein PilX
MYTKHHLSGFSRQRGIALVASLMIMLILTILGITVMNMTTLEEKMAFNTQDRYMARYMAESAILFMAKNDNLPSPNEAGYSSTSFNNLATDAPELGMDSGSGSIVYSGPASISTLPRPNPKATYLGTGDPALASGQSNAGFPVFTITATATTAAGTTASNARAGYYFSGGTMIMKE